MEIYPEYESSTLEFKAEMPRHDQIIRTILAFCNLYGGRVIIGVADDRRIIGISEDQVEKLQQAIQNSIFQSCTPTILPTIYSRRIGDKLILIVEVSSGMNKPYFKTAEGLVQGTYIRVGASTVRASGEVIDELKWRNRGRCFDQTPVYAAQLSDLDQDKIAEFLSARPVPHSGRVTNQILESYDLIVTEHSRVYPTVGGILLFGREPQKFFSEAFIIASEFSSEGMDKTLATRDCTGPVSQQIEEALAFLSTRLNVTYGSRTTKRSQSLEVPLKALREIVINAVVHRNYNVRGLIKLAIFPNRIEVFSPGGFPGPLNPAQLGDGITYIRNVALAKVLREAGYVEKLGSGFKIIFDACRQARLRKPLIVEGHNFVKCTLWRQPIDSDEEIDPIQQLIETEGTVSTADVQRYCGISRSTAVRRLSLLVKEKKIRRTGKGPRSRYDIP